MPQQTINLGSAPNDGTGDPLRTAFDKCNDNFDELYPLAEAAVPEGAITTSGLTMATDRLLGRDTASTGAVEEIDPTAWFQIASGLLVPKFRGCLAVRNGDQTTANYTTSTAIPFDGADVYDTDSIHDPASNNTRLSVPSGVSYVRLIGNVSVTLGTAGDWLHLTMRKTGSTFPNAGGPRLFVEAGTATPAFQLETPVLQVTGGTDYFELFLQVESDTSITVTQANTWFAMELLG